LLEKSSTRRVLQQAEYDSASLFVHRDTDSFISNLTDNLSKLSVVFSFDRELFVSKVYERVLRGSIKESLRRQQGSVEAIRRSLAIDRRIDNDLRMLRRECNVLLFGRDESGMSELVKQWKIIHNGGHTAEELAAYRLTIYENVINCAKTLIKAMEQFEIRPERESNQAYCGFLLNYSLDLDPTKPLGTEIGEAISSIWQDPCIPKILERSNEFSMMDSAT
jgi:hypothetical protein